jgi:hypothetical protein
MTVEAWLAAVLAEADRVGLPELKPLLETLARATKQLRAADWNEDASGLYNGALTERPKEPQ